MRTSAFMASLIALAAAVMSAQRPMLALVNVAVVDVVAGTTASDMSVLIEGETIAAVGPARTTTVPAGTTTIDSRGEFVIPGLWDMHTHLSYARSGALLASSRTA